MGSTASSWGWRGMAGQWALTGSRWLSVGRRSMGRRSMGRRIPAIGPTIGSRYAVDPTSPCCRDLPSAWCMECLCHPRHPAPAIQGRLEALRGAQGRLRGWHDPGGRIRPPGLAEALCLLLTIPVPEMPYTAPCVPWASAVTSTLRQSPAKPAENPPAAIWRGFAESRRNNVFPAGLARHGMMWPAASWPGRVPAWNAWAGRQCFFNSIRSEA